MEWSKKLFKTVRDDGGQKQRSEKAYTPIYKYLSNIRVLVYIWRTRTLANIGGRRQTARSPWSYEHFLFSVGLAVRVAVVHVLAVGARVREAFEALTALERLLAAVQPFVFGQVVLVLERFGALVAFVRPLTLNKPTVVKPNHTNWQNYRP